MLKKVLYIEDDAVTQMLFTSLNKRVSIAEDVIIASHGREAISYYESLLQHNSYDGPRMVLLDLNMPIMNGWEFLDEFQQRFADHFNETKVVILTSSNSSEDVEKAKKYPLVVDILEKPLKTSTLQELKNKFTEHRTKKEKNNLTNLFNINKLKKYTSDSEDIMKEMLEIYLEKFEDEMGYLQEAITREDKLAVKKQAHKLKTSTEIFGLESINDSVKQIENMAKQDGDFRSIKEVMNDLSPLISLAVKELNILLESLRMSLLQR